MQERLCFILTEDTSECLNVTGFGVIQQTDSTSRKGVTIFINGQAGVQRLVSYTETVLVVIAVRFGRNQRKHVGRDVQISPEAKPVLIPHSRPAESPTIVISRLGSYHA